MGWPLINLSEKLKCILAKVSGSLCLVSIPLFLFMFTSAVYIEVTVQDKINLMEGAREALPAYMLILSVASFFMNLLGSRVCWVNANVKKRAYWSKFLFPFVIISLVIFTCVFVAAIMCFTHISSLRKLFEKGILHTMKKYSHQRSEKRMLDLLQIEYECCGSHGYRDWFKIRFVSNKWISHRYMYKEEEDTYTNFKDNVPFSCCNPRIKRPCIHTRIHQLHYKYDHDKQVTIYTKGCNDAVMTFYEDVLSITGLIVFVTALIQIGLAVTVRLLQTGLQNASDDPFKALSDTTAYIFPSGGGKAEEQAKETEEEAILGPDEDKDEEPEIFEEAGPTLDNFVPDPDLDEISDTGSFVSDYDEPPQDYPEDLPEPPKSMMSVRSANKYVPPPVYPEDLPEPPKSMMSVRSANKYVNEGYSAQ